jgi:hypothetical protein
VVRRIQTKRLEELHGPALALALHARMQLCPARDGHGFGTPIRNQLDS